METVISAGAHAAALWTSLNLLLLVLLSGLVVRQRSRLKVAFGDAGSAELLRASRAFGNAAEYIPAGIGALGVLALVGVNPIAIHGVGATLFVGRVCHALGLSLAKAPRWSRVPGMMFTWLSLLFAGALLLFYAI
jgi:uncharacterized membrane protein YecN with MAPEG domain